MSSPYRDPLCGYEPTVPAAVPVACDLARGHDGPHQNGRWQLDAREYARLGGAVPNAQGHWVDCENLSMCLGGCPACGRVAAAQQEEIDDNPLGFYTGAFGSKGVAEHELHGRVRKLEEALEEITALHPRKRRF